MSPDDVTIRLPPRPPELIDRTSLCATGPGRPCILQTRRRLVARGRVFGRRHKRCTIMAVGIGGAHDAGRKYAGGAGRFAFRTLAIRLPEGPIHYI